MSRYSFFDYQSKYKENKADRNICGTTKKDSIQAAKDWDRNAVDFTITVNGVQKPVKELHVGNFISENENDNLETDKGNFKAFIKKYLACNVPVEQQDKLTELATMNLHQTGIMFATQLNLTQLLSDKLGLTTMHDGMRTKVNFTPTKEGIKIVEEVIIDYCRGPKNGNNQVSSEDGYLLHAKSEYLLTTDYVKVLDIKLDCDDDEITEMLADKKDIFEKVYDFVRNIFDKGYKERQKLQESDKTLKVNNDVKGKLEKVDEPKDELQGKGGSLRR